MVPRQFIKVRRVPNNIRVAFFRIVQNRQKSTQTDAFAIGGRKQFSGTSARVLVTYDLKSNV